MAEPRFQVKISLFDDGTVQVQDFPTSKIVALGLMDLAKDVIRNYQPQAQQDASRIVTPDEPRVVVPELVVPE